MTRLFGFVLISALTFGFSGSAFAVSMAPFDSRSLNEDEKTLVLTEGSLVNYKHLLAKCGPPKPGQDPCWNITTINIKVPLYGCVDDLIATTNSTVDKESSKILVNVTAITIVSEASRTARCVAQPERMITLHVRSSLLKVKGVDVSFQRRFADAH